MMKMKKQEPNKLDKDSYNSTVKIVTQNKDIK